jgi:septal ring factor EnvC (AmiA/AmiB activator)
VGPRPSPGAPNYNLTEAAIRVLRGAVASMDSMAYTRRFMKAFLHWLVGTFAALWLLVAIADINESEQAAEAEQGLAEVRQRIADLEKETRKAVKRRGAAEQALRKAETSESKVRGQLKRVEDDVAAFRNRLTALRAEIEKTEKELTGHRTDLERQLRLAYVAGREDWLRAALSQRDPAEIGRQFVYASYFARQRSGLLAAVGAELQSLEESRRAVSREQTRLEETQRDERERLAELADARKGRRVALAKIDKGIESQSDQLERLRLEAEDFETLVADLTRLLANLPITGSTPFLTSKGRLDWPAQGRLIREFGQARADGQLRWQGVLLGASAGTEVHAIHHGRVVYSDWLPGMGLLLVIEHSDGYLSLYGHNQDLIMDVGEWVAPGAIVALVGDRGGQALPGLYFEIRENGRPVDPSDWIHK